MKLVHVLAVLAIAGGSFAQRPPAGQKMPQESPQNTQQVSDAKLKQLESTYRSTKATFAKKPKDAKLKKSYVDATFAVGMGRMYSVSLPPHAKYSTALEAFREVLKVEPKHKDAKANYDLIAGIYRRMHKPVPGEK